MQDACTDESFGPGWQVWDAIIALLAGRNPDLRSCALVSRAFCASAQPHVFHHVGLQRLRRGKRGLRTTLPASALRRFLLHLPPYIRSMRLDIERDIYAEVLKLGLPKLRCLHVSGSCIVGSSNYPSEESIGQLGRLIVSPSIRRLEITVSGVVPQKIFQYAEPHVTELASPLITSGQQIGPHPSLLGNGRNLLGFHYRSLVE
ncbi:hypothetical protein C8R43DRAFT_198714 [Mycena crocata]|nr:hypothetical protein C8R43DRAFT_198714 [Mycena crocata]